MKVCNVDRNAFYQIVRESFNRFKINPIACEVGVLKGDNAEKILENLNPKKIYLIDEWKCQEKSREKKYLYHKEYLSWELDKDFVAKVTRYYGGDTNSQKTYDDLFAFVKLRFKKYKNVEIIRESSIDGFKKLNNIEERDIDYIYIDADHDYEFVLDDLLFYSKKLSHVGIIQINDCCHSEASVKQNFGVLEAAVNFCKIMKFEPALITNRNWSDAILVPKGGQQSKVIHNIVENSNCPFVEVPDSLLGGMKDIGKGGRNISFL